MKVTRWITMDTGWRRLIGCHISVGHFPQKSPRISGSFARHSYGVNHSYVWRHSFIRVT